MQKPLILLGDVEKNLDLVKDKINTVAPMFLQLSQGDALGMPHSRTMPEIGPRCHELRFKDGKNNWRIIYRTDNDALLLVTMFKKKSKSTPKKIIKLSQNRLRQYDIDKMGG